jgi:hypothetical protein
MCCRANGDASSYGGEDSDESGMCSRLGEGDGLSRVCRERRPGVATWSIC